MNWTHSKLKSKRGPFARARAALRYEAIALADTEPRRFTTGPTSFPAKLQDAVERALIDAALRERGLKA